MTAVATCTEGQQLVVTVDGAVLGVHQVTISGPRGDTVARWFGDRYRTVHDSAGTWAVGTDGYGLECVDSVAVTVASAPVATLPVTGTDPGLLVAGAVLIVAGAMMLRWGRRFNRGGA